MRLRGCTSATVESNGGYLNGSTHPDYTDYFEVLPSNKLAVALWLEADRMRSLAITDENLTNQKEAVKQERRMRIDNRPYMMAIVDNWPELAFRNWRTTTRIIGSFEDLNAASVADVASSSRPTTRRITRCWSSSEISITRKRRSRSKRTSPISSRSRSQNTPTWPNRRRPRSATAVAQGRPCRSPHGDPRLPGTEATVAGLLRPGDAGRRADRGDSSRFQQNLVKGKQSVIEFETGLGWPFGQPADYVDPGAYGMFMVHNPQFTGRQVAIR